MIDLAIYYIYKICEKLMGKKYGILSYNCLNACSFLNCDISGIKMRTTRKTSTFNTNNAVNTKRMIFVNECISFILDVIPLNDANLQGVIIRYKLRQT